LLNSVGALAVVFALPFQVGEPEGGEALTYIVAYLVVGGPIFVIGVIVSLSAELKRTICLAINGAYLAGWVAIIAMDYLFN
jgi:hypothetical protein